MGRRWTLTGAAPDSGQPVVMYACQRWGLKFADESYIGHKNKSSRAIGTYKRSKSAAVLQTTSSNNNNYKIADESENTTFQEPKLGQQSWNSESVLSHTDVASAIGGSLQSTGSDGAHLHNERIGTIPENSSDTSAPPVRPARPSRYGGGHPPASSVPSSTVSSINPSSSSSSTTHASMFSAKPFGVEQPTWAAHRESPRRLPPPPPASPPYDTNQSPSRSQSHWQSQGQQVLNSVNSLNSPDTQSQYSPHARNSSNDSSNTNSWIHNGNAYNTSFPTHSPSSSQDSTIHVRPGGSRSPNEDTPLALPPRDYQRRESAPVRPLAMVTTPDPKLNVPSDNNGASRRRSESSVLSTPRSEQSDTSHLSSSSHTRQPSQEELECDEKAKKLAQELADKDQKLSEVLQRDANKKRMQYMDGLFTEPIDGSVPVEKTVNVESRFSAKDRSPKHVADTSPNDLDNSKRSSLPKEYWMSPSKAILEMELRKNEEVGKDMTRDINDSSTLIKQKEELLEKLHKKLEVLKEAKVVLQQEINENDVLGKQVRQQVDSKCQTQSEKDKFSACIEDLEKIVRLLLNLSGQLARAENAVQALAPNADPKLKKMTIDKRERLYAKHEEAKHLKDDIDKRSDQLANMLRDRLDDTEFSDYTHFIKMKSKLTIELQELDDKITLGGEQIQELKKSIPDYAAT